MRFKLKEGYNETEFEGTIDDLNAFKKVKKEMMPNSYKGKKKKAEE